MQRWDAQRMTLLAQQLFKKLYQRKQSCDPNHEIHSLARTLEQWLPALMQSLVDGAYVSQPIRRYYFGDEVVDQLEIIDRIAQHVLLQELKPTFKHIVHPNCHHMLGPTGVKRATQVVEQALDSGEYHYVIRADVKSFYRSIPHFQLIQDIKQIYDDPNIVRMLTDIIRNLIDTPRGYRNPDTGIALRGPLSQLLSAIYLKPLDEAFDNMDVTYARYQDDVIILCKRKAQFNRCRRKLMNVLHQRRLSLSRKKSLFAPLTSSFHFLGIQYSGTQPPNHTTCLCDAQSNAHDQTRLDHIITTLGGVEALPKQPTTVTNPYACHYILELCVRHESK